MMESSKGQVFPNYVGNPLEIEETKRGPLQKRYYQEKMN